MSTPAPDPRDLALGIAVSAARAGLAVGRLGLRPVRLAARAPLVGPAIADLEQRGQRVRREIEPEVGRAVDQVLAGPLTEAIARSLIEQRVIERVVTEIAATTDVVQLVADALDAPLLVEVTDRVVRSAEMESAIAHIAASPELRQALAEQSTGLAEEMVGGVRRRSESLDEAAERAVRGWWRKPHPSTP